MAQAVIFREDISIPDGIDVNIFGYQVDVKGKKGELSRKFKYPNIIIKKEENKIILETHFPKKRDKAMLGTFKSHIMNMMKGLTEEFTYKMKIIYAHFPMTVKTTEKNVVIENFLGERYPRKAKIIGHSKVQIKGDEVYVSGINKEDVGQTMANIEQATKIKGRDPRVFQDGIYLVSSD
jgi:large subunit ribosomal protein L6